MAHNLAVPISPGSQEDSAAQKISAYPASQLSAERLPEMEDSNFFTTAQTPTNKLDFVERHTFSFPRSALAASWGKSPNFPWPTPGQGDAKGGYSGAELPPAGPEDDGTAGAGLLCTARSGVGGACGMEAEALSSEPVLTASKVRCAITSHLHLLGLHLLCMERDICLCREAAGTHHDCAQ